MLPMTEMEKTGAHCSGYGSHPRNNSGVLGLSSDGSAKKTGSGKFSLI